MDPFLDTPERVGSQYRLPTKRTQYIKNTNGDISHVGKFRQEKRHGPEAPVVVMMHDVMTQAACHLFIDR